MVPTAGDGLDGLDGLDVWTSGRLDVWTSGRTAVRERHDGSYRHKAEQLRDGRPSGFVSVRQKRRETNCGTTMRAGVGSTGSANRARRLDRTDLNEI